MKITLSTHLALCVFLSAAVVALALHRPTPVRPAPKSSQPARQESTPERQLSIATTASSTLYSDLTSTADRRKLIIDRLRALGVPNDVLALVAYEDFEVEWDKKFDACRGNSEKLDRVQLEKDMGKDAAMRAALGEDGFKQWDTKTMLWEAMSTAVDVTPAEAESIYALKKKLQQRQFELDEARMNGTMDPAQVIQATKESFAEYNNQLKAVLGDERYAKSQQLDDGFLADNLHYELAQFNPSDSQYQALMKVEKDWNKSFAELDQSSPDYLQKFKALNEQREKEYEQVLGPAALYALREQEDPAYIQMKKYENIWNLNDANIDSVYIAMNQYRKAVGDYQIQVQQLQSSGQNVDWTAVNNNLKQLAAQTQDALRSSVGEDSFNKLQQNGVLRWAGSGFRPVYGATVPRQQQ